METRIHELEAELDSENRRMMDATKNLRKSERRIQELTFQQDEDRKNHERMQVRIFSCKLYKYFRMNFIIISKIFKSLEIIFIF